MKNIGLIVIGLIVGVIATGIVFWNMMPGMMLTVHKSSLGFDETVSAIEKSVADTGTWKIPTIHDLQNSLVKAGHGDMTKLKIVELCQPHYAYDVLKNDADKRVAAIMPCRIGIYEDKDGQVYLAEMNVALVSKMFGGNIKKVMGGVAKEESEMLKDIIEKE